MSAVTLQQHDNGVWYLHWTDGRRTRRCSAGTRSLPEAEIFRAQWILMAQQAPADPAAVFTVAELWSVYDKKHVEHEVASPDTIRFCWKNLAPHFGHLKLADIEQDTVDEYERRRSAGKIGRKAKASTVRKELATLRAAINWHADPRRGKKRLVQAAEVPAFELPADSEPRDRWLRTEEMQRLLTAAGTLRRGPRMSRGERFLWLALETAARKQALLDLTWDRVDFETNVIHLDVPGRVKTKKRRADVPISKALRPVLERMLAERQGPLVLDNKGAVWALVQNVAIAAGFSEQNVGRSQKPKATGISPHTLRHTAATHMARRGVPLWIIAKILGNTLAMVEKVYAKHCPDDLREAVDQISGGFLEAAE